MYSLLWWRNSLLFSPSPSKKDGYSFRGIRSSYNNLSILVLGWHYSIRVPSRNVLMLHNASSAWTFLLLRACDLPFGRLPFTCNIAICFHCKSAAFLLHTPKASWHYFFLVALILLVVCSYSLGSHLQNPILLLQPALMRHNCHQCENRSFSPSLF